jgi:hypothetical protein
LTSATHSWRKHGPGTGVPVLSDGRGSMTVDPSKVRPGPPCCEGAALLKIGKSTYRLVGVDTNVISEILRDQDGARRGFISRFVAGYIPCFSPYSMFELRKRPDIYEQFLEFFDVYTCMELKNEEQLFDDELAGYPSATDIDPAIWAFSYFNTPRGTNLKNLMDITFKNPDTLRREQEWPQLKLDLLAGWVALKANYPPKGSTYIAPEGIPFVKRATLQNVAERAPGWARGMQDSGEAISSAAFPSIRMTLWTVFFRLYVARRQPTPQDVFDVLISTPAPYLDAVVTEKHQAEIYRQVKKLDHIIDHLDIYTLKDLRAQLGA